MAHQVQVDPLAREQIRHLPAAALKELAEALTVLQISPWSGEPFRQDNPDGPLRTLAFGPAGLITYLVLEEQQIADVLSVQWSG